ncbi:enolase 1 [Tanacetum coccineum]
MDSFTKDAIASDDQDTTSDVSDGRIINSAESSMSINFMYKVVIGMAVAASELYSEIDKTYDLNFKEEYPIVSIEDSFDQDDWEHYGKMTAECGEHVQIVSDDLLVTNPMFHPTALSDKGLPITSNRSTKTKEDVFLITEAAKGDGGFLLISRRKGAETLSCLRLYTRYKALAYSERVVQAFKDQADAKLLGRGFVPLEAISSLCFAAPTCTDLPELIHVQLDFAEKLDEEFVAAVTELMPEYGVSCQLTDFVAGLTGGLLGINNLLGDLTDFSLAADLSKTLNTLTHS